MKLIALRRRGGKALGGLTPTAYSTPRLSPAPRLGRGSSLMSLRGAHHRRDPSAARLCGQHNGALPGQRAWGGPRSEIKEEPKAGDIRGGGHPVALARALKVVLLRVLKSGRSLHEQRVAYSAMED
jgi:hypothetical protein